MSLGYSRLNTKPFACIKRFGEDDSVFLVLYVDDMLVASPNKDQMKQLKAQLAKEFKIKDLGPINKILKIQIH